MKVKVYTIFTCHSCMEYVQMLVKLATEFGYECEIYDIDYDPILSVEYLMEHRESTNSIPFFAVYKDSLKQGCYSDILDQGTLETILKEHAKN